MTNSPPDGDDRSFPYQADDDFPNEFQLKLREFYDFFGLADKDLPIVIGFFVGKFDSENSLTHKFVSKRWRNAK